MLTPEHPQPGELLDDKYSPLVLNGSAKYLETCSLVLSAVGIRHSIDPDRSVLSVPAPHSERARRQLDLYFRENTGWPEKPAPVQQIPRTEKPPTLLMVGGLAIFFLVTGPWKDESPWFLSGAINSQLMFDHGEWWRLITALTLHADQVHLLGNCVIGGFLVHLLCKSIGSGLGWFSLIFSGALGNMLNILLRDQVHYSVGFSTSIFAAIGIFSGLQIRTGKKNFLREIIIPIGAGAGLLAMLGTEGERTDLGAHFFGFACGLGLGFVLNRFDIHQLAVNKPLQDRLFMLTLLIIPVSWIIALG